MTQMDGRGKVVQSADVSKYKKRAVFNCSLLLFN